MSMVVRSCDRCARLKTQCNGDNPCNRCERLRLECTQTRPILAKGRPRRESTDPRARRTANDNRLQSASPQSSSGNVSPYNSASEQFQALIQGLEDLPLPEAVAAFALESMLTLRTNIGFLIAVLNVDAAGWEPSITPSQDIKLATKIPIHSKALLYTIIYIGTLSNALRDAVNDLIELQQCALNSVPALQSNARELTIEDAISLSFLSYASCLAVGTEKSAERWNALACSIARQQQDLPKEGTLSPFYQKALLAVVINDRVMSLLHNKHPSDLRFEVPDAPWTDSRRRKDSVVLDKMSIVGVLDLPPNATTQPSLNTDYFSLYSPLIRILNIALDRPIEGGLLWQSAFHELDQYILHFPPGLKSYESVATLFQVEAIVWYHGLFLLMFGGHDLHMYFHDHTHYTSPKFVHCMEHSLLIGETLPTVTQLMRSAIEISPATIYFVLLSSVIQAVALRTCTEYLSPDNRPVDTPRGVPASITALLGSIVAHITLLRKIRLTSMTSMIALIGEVESFTENIYNAAMSTGNAVDVTMSNPLKSYRWTARGLGIIKLDSKLTQELEVPEVPVSSYGESNNVAQRMASARDILALLELHSKTSTPRRLCKTIRHP